MNRLNQNCSYDGPCARKRYQCNGYRHENRSGDSSFVGLLIHLIDNPRRQCDFESAKKACGKNDKYQRKENIGDPVGADKIDSVRTKGHGNDCADDCIKANQAD